MDTKIKLQEIRTECDNLKKEIAIRKRSLELRHERSNLKKRKNFLRNYSLRSKWVGIKEAANNLFLGSPSLVKFERRFNKMETTHNNEAKFVPVSGQPGFVEKAKPQSPKENMDFDLDMALPELPLSDFELDLNLPF